MKTPTFSNVMENEWLLLILTLEILANHKEFYPYVGNPKLKLVIVKMIHL